MKSYESMSRSELIDLLRSFENAKYATPMGKLVQLSSYDGEFERWPQNRALQEDRRNLEKCYSHADFYDFAPIGFVIFDARGVIREINLAGAEMLGRERSLLLNTPFISHIIKSDRKKFLCHLARCKQDEGRVVSAISVSMERGNSFHLQLQSIVGRDLLSDIPFYLTALIDVSEIAELRSLAEGLTRNEEKVRQAVAAELQEQVLGGLNIAHVQLGSLICSVNSSEQKNAVGTIGETVDLAIRRVESLARRIWPADTEATSLQGALNSLVRMLREEQGIPVEFQSDMLSIPVDEATSATIFQVIRELLENAARYAQATRIVISLTMNKGNIVANIEDNGVGFHQDRIIDSAGKGGGIGIRNSKRRIENIGGAIQIDSAPHGGTSVTLLVPLKEKKKESGSRVNARESEALPERIDLPA